VIQKKRKHDGKKDKIDVHKSEPEEWVPYEMQFYAKFKRIIKWGKEIKIQGNEGKKPRKT